MTKEELAELFEERVSWLAMHRDPTHPLISTVIDEYKAIAGMLRREKASDD